MSQFRSALRSTTTLDGVLLHLCAQLRCDRRDACMVGLELISISQGLKGRKNEVGARQPEAVLARLHVALSYLHGVGDGPLHGRVDDAAPHGPAAPLLQVLLESGAGPHVVTGQQGAAVLVVLQVLLDRVVAQVDGAGWGKAVSGVSCSVPSLLPAGREMWRPRPRLEVLPDSTPDPRPRPDSAPNAEALPQLRPYALPRPEAPPRVRPKPA